MDAPSGSNENSPITPPNHDDRSLLDDLDNVTSSSTSSSQDMDDDPGVPLRNFSEGSIPRCNCSNSGKNLVVCIDGTSNQFGDKNTNVIELYKLIKKEVGDAQFTYYNSGIGTYAQPSWKSLSYYKQVFSHKIDLAFALKFERILLDAYRWISETYETGDRIFLFGFSRGAYQVRTLSAMIDKVGVIHRGNEKQIPFAYQLYRHSDHESPNTIDKALTFKETFSRRAKVHFVGAWDTVSSVGITRAHKLLPGTANGMRHVCHFRHALALDERRVKFLPEYACGGSGPPSPSLDTEGFSDAKEVWFAGTHSDIGGGNIDNLALNNTRPALRWMFSEASLAGLRLNAFERKLEDDKGITVNESLTGIWWLLEYLPLRRPMYATEHGADSGDTTRRLHRGVGRAMQIGQKIHPSVWLSEDLAAKYNPRAYFPSHTNFWNQRRLGDAETPLVDGTYADTWKEVDLYDVVGYFVEQYTDRESIVPDNAVQRAQLNMIRACARSEEGRRALVREIHKRLKPGKPEHDLVDGHVLCNILNIIVENSGDRPQDILGPYRSVRARLRHLLEGASKDDCSIAQQFLAQFTDFTPLVLTGNEHGARSIAVSPDGKHLLSGSRDGTVRIWDTDTGKTVGLPYMGHGHSAVHSVAFSADGRRFASGSYDCTIRIWAMDSEQSLQTLIGHSGLVLCVAFSPDSKHLISGSSDGEIRVWDVDEGQMVGNPFLGHSSDVYSVMFSPDGKYVASGSDDYTIRIWDVETEQTVTVLRGHRDSVFSVAFSVDGRHLVSASRDHRVRIWDWVAGRKTWKVLKGHTDAVWSAVFSPDGRLIASSSSDKTVRIWNVETGRMIGMPLTGHSGDIGAVSFLPDGQRVASCTEWGDCTLRIWDVIQDPV